MGGQSLSDYATDYVAQTTPPDSTGPDFRSAAFWEGIVIAALELAKATGIMHDQAGAPSQHVDSNVEEFD